MTGIAQLLHENLCSCNKSGKETLPKESRGIKRVHPQPQFFPRLELSWSRALLPALGRFVRDAAGNDQKGTDRPPNF